MKTKFLISQYQDEGVNILQEFHICVCVYLENRHANCQ